LNHTLKAIIIGSGIAGISSSIRLAEMGFDVTIYEANDYPGGKITTFEENGFRFDAGPSVFTMPVLIDEIFELSGLNPRNYFRYTEIDTTCHYFYEDGTFIKAFADKSLLKKEIDQKLNGQGQKVINYLEESAKIYELTSHIFLERSLHKFRNYISVDTLKALARIRSLNLNNTMNQVNLKKLGHEKLVQLFNRFATYNGSSPYQAPGVLILIPHLEFNLGSFFPNAGMHSITTSLVNLAKSRGVNIQYNSKIERIILDSKRIKGVQLNGNIIESNAVLSNMDVVPTYEKLMPDLRRPRQVMEQERSSSAMIFFWGIDREFPELDLHNIFFSGNYEEEFKYIFKKLDVFDDPTVYVNISSKYRHEDAPEGNENWFVMINVPSNAGQDWDDIKRKSKTRILRKLSRILKCEIKNHIISESVLDPRTIESKTSSYKGSLYGASSNNWLSAFIRHPNFHKNIRGLYFCGGSVHPGGGIPLSILSGKIACEIIRYDFKIQ
jgi:phytoene desaturase